MEKPNPIEYAVELLKRGYSQKVVSKRSGVWLRGVSAIARAHGIGRKVGETRKRFEQRQRREMQARSPAQAIESFMNHE